MNNPLSSIKGVVFLQETYSVLCELRTEVMCTVYMKAVWKGLNVSYNFLIGALLVFPT